MAESTRCPYCCSRNTTFKRLVERSYLHPLMGIILATLTAGFVSINTGQVLWALLVAVGIGALLLLAPVTKRVIGFRQTCQTCGHRWTTPPASRESRRRSVR